jgi:hypothetical protein
MSNVLATSSLVGKIALAVLKNNLPFAGNVNRDYEQEFVAGAKKDYQPGQTILIKRPPRYTYRAGRVAVPQGTVEPTTPLTLGQGGVDMQFTSAERTVSLSKLEDKVAAAMAAVCNEIDRQGLELARFATFRALNPTGVRPTSAALAIQAMADMGQHLHEQAAPNFDRQLVLSPSLNGALIQGFGGYFNSPSTVTKQNQTGMMQDSYGFNVGVGQNVSVHTNGAGVASNVNGANQVGSSITVAATTGGTITRGTKITLPGVFSVNPQSRQSTGILQGFTVTADVLVGATVIPVAPALVVAGPFQNVTASPTTAQPFVVQGAANTAYNTNVAYHKDAFTLAMVPMFDPSSLGIDCKQQTMDGFTVKVTQTYDGVNDFANMRLDVLFGWAATYPELAALYYSV